MLSIANKIVKPESWITARDDAFKEVERKLNEAIQKEVELKN
jgi:hypothetical protein